MKVAILQSNYIPWKGYFDLINKVDRFIFLDDVQFTTGGWRNRNKIKTEAGLKWLTIPCGSNKDRRICDVRPADYRWQRKHWKTIQYAYGKAPYFFEYKEFLEQFYLGQNWLNLSALNQYFITHVSTDILGIDVEFLDSRYFEVHEKKAERVLRLLELSNADSYLSGPAAKDYLNPADFENRGITLEWMDYSEYTEYAQLHGEFEHAVSIIDLLVHVGPEYPKYMKTFVSAREE